MEEPTLRCNGYDGRLECEGEIRETSAQARYYRRDRARELLLSPKALATMVNATTPSSAAPVDDAATASGPGRVLIIGGGLVGRAYPLYCS